MESFQHTQKRVFPSFFEYPNIKRLHSIGLHTINPNLRSITKLLKLIENPHLTKKYIIVGGTNGKYSVSKIVADILISNNYKTGLYTSPHLIDITERIRINNISITKQKLDETLGKIFYICDKNNIHLSYFELLTASAFLYFANQNIDIGILEVGMGGRWDATNVVKPLVSIITNVSFDHMQYLGNTLSKIAKEKAEIIKSNSIAITGAQGKPLEIIRKKAYSENSILYVSGIDFNCEAENEQTLNYKGIFENLKIGTKQQPLYQVKNIGIAICCSEILKNNFKYKINNEKLKESISNITLEGRFEFISGKEPIILDGAHNEASAIELVRSLKHFYPNKRFNFLVSMLKDKDSVSFFRHIVPISSTIVVAEIPNSERSESSYNLAKAVSQFTDNYKIENEPFKAFQTLRNRKEPLCVTGSLYLIGYIKECLKK